MFLRLILRSKLQLNLQRWVCLSVVFSRVAFGAPLPAQLPSPMGDEMQIPSTPSAPPGLVQKRAPSIAHCERYFLYQGKKIECDSNLGSDGEVLRPLMKDVPSAVSELDTYQHNRWVARNLAYLGTAGLIVLIAGAMFGREKYIDTSTNINSGKEGDRLNLLGRYLYYGGAGVAGGSGIYGFSLVRSNEAHIGNAVENYNRVNPDNLIELQFSTGIHF